MLSTPIQFLQCGTDSISVYPVRGGPDVYVGNTYPNTSVSDWNWIGEKVGHLRVPVVFPAADKLRTSKGPTVQGIACYGIVDHACECIADGAWEEAIPVARVRLYSDTRNTLEVP